MIIFESDYWRPQIDSFMKHRQPSGMKRAERAYRRTFGRHRAVQFEIRECLEEVSAAGMLGDIVSWPLGRMPDGEQRAFYRVYACRHNGELVALFDSKSLEECRKVIWRLERAWLKR